MNMELEPSLNTWTTIFLVVVLHGIILSSIFFFRKKGRRKPNVFLGFFLLLFSLNILSNTAIWTKYNLVFPHLMGMSATFQFLYGPLLFVYVLSVLKPNRGWMKWDLLHLVPFLIQLARLLPVYLMSVEEKAGYLEESMQSTFELTDTGLVIVTLKVTHMAIYAGLLFNLKKLGNPFKIRFQRISTQKLQWVRLIKYSFLGFLITYALFFVLVETIGYRMDYDYIISFAMTGFIFTIGYAGFINPNLLYDAHNGSKYENSSLADHKADRYLEKLLTYMENKKPYIDGDLKLEDLAAELKIPRHHLSQVINERLGKNFFEFVNSYRVDEAKKILTDPERANDIILRVALESGFNNKTTFNSAFKKRVGTTPSQYRKKS